jgi:hypothetical protein
VLSSCPIAATADTVIYVTELSGAADLLIAEAADGDVRITTTQTAVEGNDIRVIHDGTMQVAEDQPPVAVPNGLVFAHNGSVTLLAADNVVTDPSAQILATTRDGDIPVVQPNPNLPKTTTGNIDIFADWHPTVVDPNANDGAVIVLRGEVTPGTDGLTRVLGALQGRPHRLRPDAARRPDPRLRQRHPAATARVLAGRRRLRHPGRLPHPDDACRRHDPDPRRPGRRRRLRRLGARVAGRRRPLCREPLRQRCPR